MGFSFAVDAGNNSLFIIYLFYLFNDLPIKAGEITIEHLRFSTR